MKEYRLTDWLPTTKKEVELRGWDELDVILFSGDAYIDHPSFGAAVIGRILEAEGLRVAIIPQPNWRDDLRDFKKLGRPRLFGLLGRGENLTIPWQEIETIGTDAILVHTAVPKSPAAPHGFWQQLRAKLGL